MPYKILDTEAFDQLADALLAGQTLILDFETRTKACAFRHKFYTYRKVEQKLRNDPSFLATATISLGEKGEVTIRPRPFDFDLRKAMGSLNKGENNAY